MSKPETFIYERTGTFQEVGFRVGAGFETSIRVLTSAKLGLRSIMY